MIHLLKLQIPFIYLFTSMNSWVTGANPKMMCNFEFDKSWHLSPGMEYNDHNIIFKHYIIH